MDGLAFAHPDKFRTIEAESSEQRAKVLRLIASDVNSEEVKKYMKAYFHDITWQRPVDVDCKYNGNERFLLDIVCFTVFFYF